MILDGDKCWGTMNPEREIGMQEFGEENSLISNMLIRETLFKKVEFKKGFGGCEGVNNAYI